ncbi:MAG: ribonuclease P protein subunit [archaeon]
MRKEKTFPDELIGKEIKIINSKNKTYLGLEGKIVDETRNTIQIETKTGIKTVLKSAIDFEIKDSGQKIKGITIKKRPEERLKG